MEAKGKPKMTDLFGHKVASVIARCPWTMNLRQLQEHLASGYLSNGAALPIAAEGIPQGSIEFGVTVASDAKSKRVERLIEERDRELQNIWAKAKKRMNAGEYDNNETADYLADHIRDWGRHRGLYTRADAQDLSRRVHKPDARAVFHPHLESYCLPSSDLPNELDDEEVLRRDRLFMERHWWKTVRFRVAADAFPGALVCPDARDDYVEHVMRETGASDSELSFYLDLDRGTLGSIRGRRGIPAWPQGRPRKQKP